MNISFKGYKNNTLTVEADGSLTVGVPVTLSAEGKAIAAGENKDFIGVCTAIRNGWASVQTDGYIELKYTGTAPKCGIEKLSAAGSGKVKVTTGDAYAYYKVLSVDSDETTVGFIL